jgi:hypothetical protein
MVKGGLGCALSSSCSARIEWINLSFTLQRTSASCLPTSRHTLAALKLLGYEPKSLRVRVSEETKNN